MVPYFRARDPFHSLECELLCREGRVPDRDEVRVMLRAIAKLLKVIPIVVV